jgi:hypothetical protein
VLYIHDVVNVSVSDKYEISWVNVRVDSGRVRGHNFIPAMQRTQVSRHSPA